MWARFTAAPTSLLVLALGCGAREPGAQVGPASGARASEPAACVPASAGALPACVPLPAPTSTRPIALWPSSSDLFVGRERKWRPPVSDSELVSLVRREELGAKLGGERRAWLDGADRAYRRREWHSARAGYARFVAASPADGLLRPFAQFRLSQALWNLGKRTEALTALAPLSGVAELASAVRHDVITLHAETSSHLAAQRSLPADALDELGQAYLDRGRWPEARGLYEQLLRAAPAERRCALRSRLTEVAMIADARSPGALLQAAKEQIEQHRAFQTGPHADAAKRECTRVTLSQVIELTAAAQVEAVGSDGVKGTGDRRTAELARVLQRWLLDELGPGQLDSLSPNALGRSGLLPTLTVRIAAADLLAFLQDWKECGAAYERAAAAGGAPSRVALGALRCHAMLSRQSGRHRTPAKAGDAPEELSELDQRILTSASAFLCAPDASPGAPRDHLFAELSRGRVFYERRQLPSAVNALREAALAGPAWAESVDAAVLELEALAVLRTERAPDPCRDELARLRPRLLEVHCTGDRQAPSAACKKLRETGAGELRAPTDGGRRKVDEPKLRVDRVTVTGTTIPATVQRVLRLSSGRLDVCYADSLRRGYDASGRHEVELEIRRDGQVGWVRSGKSSLVDPALVGCIEGVLTTIGFAQTEGGVLRARYAIELSPERGVHTLSELSFRVGE